MLPAHHPLDFSPLFALHLTEEEPFLTDKSKEESQPYSLSSKTQKFNRKRASQTRLYDIFLISTSTSTSKDDSSIEEE